ncbi:glucosaminidase domain-containing protein [Globicatella sp. PHS-GS-PNBC-21-1553]|uniref:glucosaminidase domain-containing protein n=1 Tax=Globicatella sp. PHS-GS-PNBC-21-1553 TaxID=2885764 RepID=UPI00298ED6F1|nr:glucosaminidase domain-containing protein [Globicatella sp. PHS-GS-PNBC-21-1553]WPC08016.1 glucosaminidase domain-containing protein [Globicatella sp. PHS-GS-PNBC-21-1553]
MSKTQFINAVKNGAISGWHKHKILPSISIAQAILESGWGGSDLSKAPNYNLFGIKASDDWAGEVVNMPTQEWSQSKGYYWIRANFRKYNSWDESIEDHSAFFTNTPWRKQNYARVIGEKDYKVAAKMLRECGYATDIEYPNKLIRIIDQYNLTQYDRIAFEGGITNTTTPPTNTMSPDYYLRKTVGDSLSSGSEATAKHIDVTFIGDSLLVGTEPKLKRFKWKKANYNAKGSRQWTHTDVELNAIEQLKTMLANGQVHNYVVFVLGTNRGVTADEIKQAVDLCGAGRKILLVDTLSEVAHREAVTQAYKQASEQYSNVFYGDWSRYSKLRMDDNYYKDGPNGERIHMTPIGYERHANFIMHALYQMYNYGNTSGTPKNMRSVADIEYDDGIFTSPIGETIIYNKKLNDQFSFKSKKGSVLWIEKVLQTDKEDPQEAIAEGVAYMKEHAHPAVHYTVKLKELPDTVSIGDTGIFIDHEFNPPLAIEARILNITTSETNKNANTVTIGNVKELFPQSKEDILALQQQLQATREELLTQAYLDDVYEVKIESSNGLALAGGAEGFGKDLIEKVEGNTFYIRKPKSLSNGFKIKGKIDDKHLINRHDGLVADSLTNPIDFNPDYENPQGSDTAYPLKPFDSHELEVSDFTATFYDESGGVISTYKVPIYLDGNFNLPVKFERAPHTMKITSDVDITFDYILVFEEYLSVEEDETTELTARVFKNGVEITDEIDHFSWTKVSSDGREDEGWKDLNKFNQTNKITIKASDLKDFESRFNVKAFDKQIEELIASNGVTIKNQISPAIAAAKAEAERMDAEIKKEIDTVLDRFDTERTETEQAINEALESAKAEAERLDEERQQAIDTKMQEVNKKQSTLEQSIATAEQNAQSALQKAGASESLAKTAKEVSENALANIGTVSTELSEVKTQASDSLIKAQEALDATGTLSTQVQSYEETVDGYKSEVANYSLTNETLTARVNSYEETVDGYSQSLTRVEGKFDNLEIGGMNLLYNSGNFIDNYDGWESNGGGISIDSSNKYRGYNTIKTEFSLGIRSNKWYRLENNVVYTYSAVIKSDVAFPHSYSVPLHYWSGFNEVNQGKITFLGGDTSYTNSDLGKFKKLWVTFKLIGDANSFKPYIYGEGSIPSGTVNIAYIKLEKGNKPTDWSPSAEDMVNNSDFTVYQNQVKSTTDEHTRRLTALTEDGGRISKVEQKADSIQRSLSDYAQTTYVDTKITEKAGEITTNLSKVETLASNGLKGRNLLVTRGAISKSYLGGSETYPNPSPDNSGYGTDTSIVLIPVQAGEKYTLSKITGNTQYFRISFLDENKNYVNRITSSLDKQTITIPERSRFMWVSYPSNAKPMIELGSEKSEYQEAYDDRVSSVEFQTVKETTSLYERLFGKTENNILTNVSRMAMTSDLFQVAVGDIGNLVKNGNFRDGSTYGWDIDRNRLNNSDVRANGWYATTKVRDTYATYEVDVVPNETLNVEFRAWSPSSQPFTVGFRFYDQYGEHVVWAGMPSVNLTTTPTVYRGTFKVPDKAVKGIPWVSIQKSSDFDMVWFNNVRISRNPSVDQVNSRFTQTREAISLGLYGVKDAISEVGIVKDGVRIKGNLITLDGKVNMTSGFIVPEGNIGNLSAKKITSGTIDTARLNSADIVTKGLTSNVVKSEHILANEALFTKLFTDDLATEKLATKQAWIKSSMIGDAQIGTAQIGQIDAGTGKIVNIDAQYITANHAQLVSAGFQGMNSNMHIDGGAIRIQNTAGDFATMNAIPEFRSQDSLGTAAIMGKGRSQYYSNNQSRFYIGSSLNGDEYNGSVVHGVHISKGQTWGIYRQSDAFGGTPAQYFKTPAGWGAVQVIEELMRTGKIVNNFSQASALIRGLNGWGNSFPVLQPGDMVMYQAAVAGNSSGIERIWTMGNSSNGSTRTYSHVHHVFEGGTTGVSDARLKHDIKPTDIKALDHIADLSFKQFKWNRNDKLEPLGLIAQESGILRVPDEEMEGIDLQRAMMLALKGIQELSQKVQKLEEQLK